MSTTQNSLPINKTQNMTQAMTTLFRAGREFQEFVGLRPYLTKEQVFASLELLFPLKASTLTNAEIVCEFLKDGEYRLREVTAKQYKCHLQILDKHLGKMFMLASPEEMAALIKGKSVTKHTYKKDDVVVSSHDHYIDVYSNFYKFMLDRGYRSRLLLNPVQVRRMTNKRKMPKAELIFTAEQYQQILQEVPWEAVPTTIMLFELGVRPETATRVQFSDIIRMTKELYLNRKINKIGSAWPYLYPAIEEKLRQWENCTGPISSKRLVEMVKRTVRRLGFRHAFNDDCRKTAISMRAAILRKEDFANAEARLKREFGNDQKIREIFYDATQSYEEAVAYFSAKRVQPDVVLSAKEARTMRTHQINAAVHVAYALSEAHNEHTFTSPKAKKQFIRRMAAKTAMETLSPNNLLPDFVTIDGNWEITRLDTKVEQEIAEGKQAAVLESLNELHGNDGDQLSLFHKRGNLFLESPISGAPCSPNQTASSPNNSSPNDTE